MTLPTTPGAFQTAPLGAPDVSVATSPDVFGDVFGDVRGPGSPEQDAFVAKLNATGTALLYSTFLGGLNTDTSTAIAVDAAGHAYVTGVTSSNNFPTFAPPPGAFRPTPVGQEDAFVTKLNATGTGLLYSTYLGGRRDERGNGIAVDAAGHAYVTGVTTSNDFPTTQGHLVFQCNPDESQRL